ncbi:MAG: sulfite exporter TauE/SafE family protein [Planctomycetes bacterium]|nr:sulfite exporter TauE/SafE family protein [Planctomycetota bacterium]
MTVESLLLYGAAAGIGTIHTLLGPDHYVPFIAMSRAGRWSIRKTMVVTLLCGIGHVLSSVVLGLIGVGLGIALIRLKGIEGIRNEVAAWLLIGFGIVYTLWGARLAIRNRPHTHRHVHTDGTVHEHVHIHHDAHAHVHADAEPAANLTPWILFTIFIFGPCEPLIPLVMVPAAKGHTLDVMVVVFMFGAVTLTAMLAIVWSACRALSLPTAGRLARYGHALAGLVILGCGVGVKLGL